MRCSHGLGSVALVAALLLGGCGGGGGGGSPPAPPPPPPPPPLISAQSFSGTEDTDLAGTLVLRPLAGDTATVAVATAPTRGTLTAFTAAGTFTYRPNANLNGADTFTVEATDSRNNRLSAIISVNVAAVNDAPVASGEIIEVPAGASATINVLGNDSDVDDTALSVVVPAAAAGAAEGNPAVGTATVEADNRIRLAFPAGFHGVTRVRYQVRDPAAAQSAEVNAVVFVGTPRFDVWYQGPLGMHPAQLFVTDLAGTRQVTQFVMPRQVNGAQFSANRNVALIVENDGIDLRELWTVSTRNVEAPVRMTPGHDATQTLSQFTISPDGAWVAYVVQSGGARQLWLVERANPAARRQIPLPAGQVIQAFSNVKFAATSAALYYLTEATSGSKYLYRAAVADPLNPTAIYPRAGEIGGVTEWFLAPDDSYVIARYVDIVRISVANPALRTTLNAPIPAGDFIGSMIADASATRFVYLTTGAVQTAWGDDRLWMCDTNAPGFSTLILAADPARTGPVSAHAIRPDRNAVLVDSWVASLGTFQIDLAELSLAPADGLLRQLSPPPPANSRTSNIGDYLDDDTVVYSVVEPAQLSRLYEARRGSFAAPTALVEPGVMSLTLRYSADKSLFVTTHSRNSPNDPSHYGILVNRTAPGAPLRITPATSSLLSPFFIDIVERP